MVKVRIKFWDGSSKVVECSSNTGVLEWDKQAVVGVVTQANIEKRITELTELINEDKIDLELLLDRNKSAYMDKVLDRYGKDAYLYQIREKASLEECINYATDRIESHKKSIERLKELKDGEEITYESYFKNSYTYGKVLTKFEKKGVCIRPVNYINTYKTVLSKLLMDDCVTKYLKEIEEKLCGTPLMVDLNLQANLDFIETGKSSIYRIVDIPENSENYRALQLINEKLIEIGNLDDYTPSGNVYRDSKKIMRKFMSRNRVIVSEILNKLNIRPIGEYNRVIDVESFGDLKVDKLKADIEYYINDVLIYNMAYTIEKNS